MSAQINIKANTLDTPLILELGWIEQLAYSLINQALLPITLLLLALIAIWTNIFDDRVVIIWG